jgi:DNA-binding CsgD family transcriptional regulator
MQAPKTAQLELAREHYSRRAWTQAFESLIAADRALGLSPEDLERLATSAYLIGRDDDYLGALDRAHHAYLASGEKLRGVRCAFWLGLRLLFRNEMGRATGWFARAERLVEGEDSRCVERGYLLLPPSQQALLAGDLERAHSTATAAVEIAESCDDRDLLTCAVHLQGRVLLQQGQIARGLARLDEAMLAVTGGTLSPIVTGLMYCSVIDACQSVFAARRAREWTFALSHWCDEQSEMVAFTGICFAHRAQILRLHGSWHEALAAARGIFERDAKVADRPAAAAACYEAGEVYRLRGEFAAAEDAYRNASRHGREPQPGLAQLRLAQGRTPVAVAAIRRVTGAAMEAPERIDLLPAYVDIMLAAGDIAAAHAACDELDAIAVRLDTEVVTATAAQARGAIEIAEHDAYAALVSLRRALAVWQVIDAPYLAAKTRVSIARACGALGDEDGAALELDAARAVFERLGASPDIAHVETIKQQARASRSAPHGLTPRELQVLQLLATGQTNKQIAGALALSEKTIDRHVSNILAKLCVPSRAAATAYAYRNRLI